MYHPIQFQPQIRKSRSALLMVVFSEFEVKRC